MPVRPRRRYVRWLSSAVVRFFLKDSAANTAHSHAYERTIIAPPPPSKDYAEWRSKTVRVLGSDEIPDIRKIPKTNPVNTTDNTNTVNTTDVNPIKTTNISDTINNTNPTETTVSFNTAEPLETTPTTTQNQVSTVIRKRRVCTPKCLSNFKPVLASLPQGSIVV